MGVCTGVYAFVTLKEEVSEPIDQIIKELKVTVKEQIAAYAVPEMIQVIPSYVWGLWVLSVTSRQKIFLTLLNSATCISNG